MHTPASHAVTSAGIQARACSSCATVTLRRAPAALGRASDAEAEPHGARRRGARSGCTPQEQRSRTGAAAVVRRRQTGAIVSGRGDAASPPARRSQRRSAPAANGAQQPQTRRRRATAIAAPCQTKCMSVQPAPSMNGGHLRPPAVACRSASGSRRALPAWPCWTTAPGGPAWRPTRRTAGRADRSRAAAASAPRIRGFVDVGSRALVANHQALLRHDLQQLEHGRVAALAVHRLGHFAHRARPAAQSTRRMPELGFGGFLRDPSWSGLSTTSFVDVNTTVS